MQIKIGHQEITTHEELENLVSKEIADFCKAWQKSLKVLLNEDVYVDIIQRQWGYEIACRHQENGFDWYFKFELHYPNVSYNQKINYLKINRFITLPRNRGYGKKVFQILLTCCNELKELEMIRLQSVQKATVFWKKLNFRHQEEAVEWISGNSVDFDLSCLKRPKILTKCPFIYDLKICNCKSCQQYLKCK